MKLNIKAFTIAAGLIWGGAVLTVALTSLVWDGYGVAFLQVVASIYPGYDGSATFGGVVVATLYALVDGGFAALIFAAIYNLLADRFGSESSGEATVSA